MIPILVSPWKSNIKQKANCRQHSMFVCLSGAQLTSVLSVSVRNVRRFPRYPGRKNTGTTAAL